MPIVNTALGMLFSCGGAPPPQHEGSAHLPAYVILAPSHLEDAAKALAQYRSETGLSPSILLRTELPSEPEDLLEAVRERLSEEWLEGQPTYLVLLGDTEGVESNDDGELPAFACENELGGCYTDNPYGDLDGDGIPEVAVGRIPASSLGEALSYVEKVRRHENAREIGPWNRRMALYAGYSGFGELIEIMLEEMMLKGLATMDPATEILGVYNNPLSSFFYLPFEEKVVDLFNGGSILTMYVGHGQAAEGEGLDEAILQDIDTGDRMPFLAFFACNNGKYAEDQPSIAELALFHDGGPAGVFAASDVTHPYANGLGPYELQRGIYGGAHDRFGDAVLATKQAWFSNAEDDFREFVDQFLPVFQLSEEQAAVTMRQHLDLFNYFGDPALEISLPENRLSISVEAGSASEGHLEVIGEVPGIDEGTILISLDLPRDAVNDDLAEIDQSSPDVPTVQENWERASSTQLAVVEAAVTGGQFQAVLDFDPLPPGARYIKGYAWNEADEAYGFEWAP
jgi:hypothetical protein